MKVSIVLPAYNEAKRPENSIKKVLSAAKDIGYDFEIIIAEDGSTDGTDKIASELAKRYNVVRHIHSDERLGRGRALKNAFKEANGDVLVYMDVDLSTDLTHLKELVDSIVIEGNEFLSEGHIKKRMYSRENTLWLTIKGDRRRKIQRETPERDSLEIKYLYLTKGFLNVRMVESFEITNNECG